MEDSYEPPCRMRAKPGKIIDNLDLNNAQQSLAWKVRCRSNPEELFSKGILPDKDRFANPQFLETKRRLSMAKTSDTIRRKLDNRPSRDTLQDKNILRSNNHTSPLLQASQVTLHRKRTADLLNRQLSERPGPIDLISKGILPIPPVGSTNSQHSKESTQSFFQKLTKAARRDSYSSNEDYSGWSPETAETGSNISTDSILRNKPSNQSTGISPKSKQRKNNKQNNKTKQTNKHYNFHIYTASNYRKEQPAKSHTSVEQIETDTRNCRDKKQRSSFEVCVNQQQLLLQLQIFQGYPQMKELITPDVLKNYLGATDDAESLVTEFFTQCKITQIALQERNLHELRNICKHNCLATTGKKAELIERILNHQKSKQLQMPEYPNEIPHKDSTSSMESELKSPQIPLRLPGFDDKTNIYKPLNPIHTSLPPYLGKQHPEVQTKKVPLLPKPNFLKEMPNLHLPLNPQYNTHVMPTRTVSFSQGSNCSLLSNDSICTDPLDMLQPSIQPGDCPMYAEEPQFIDASSYLNTTEDLYTQHNTTQKYYPSHCIMEPIGYQQYPQMAAAGQYQDNFNSYQNYGDPISLITQNNYPNDMMIPNMPDFVPVDGTNCNYNYTQPNFPIDPTPPNCYSQPYFGNH